MNEQKIEPCLLSKWNHSISSQKAQEEMRRLLSRRKPRRLFHDLLHRQQEGSGSKLPHQVFLTTCALFCRGQDPSQEILQAIQTAHLEEMLCVGFRLFLCNKSKQRQFTIQWTDQTFPNRYAWLTRFSGEFYSSAFEELFSTARLISQLDPDRLWEIAKEDPNDLLLLNWPDIFWEFPSTARALELLQPAQSPRRQALAFWWLTFPLQDSPQSEERAREILREASGVPETILTPLLYAFLLHQHSCPQAFRSYLIKPSRHSLLGQDSRRPSIESWYLSQPYSFSCRCPHPGNSIPPQAGIPLEGADVRYEGEPGDRTLSCRSQQMPGISPTASAPAPGTPLPRADGPVQNAAHRRN